MNDPKPRELELTPELIEYAHSVALHEAQKHCPKFVVYDDVAQDAVLELMRKPPKYDPTKGASKKTLVYTVVQRFVLKYRARQYRHASRNKQVVEPKTGEHDDRRSALKAFALAEEVERHQDQMTVEDPSEEDDLLEFIVDEESLALCLLVLECEGNLSEAARRLGVAEGTVRYRLKMLAPKFPGGRRQFLQWLHSVP